MRRRDWVALASVGTLLCAGYVGGMWFAKRAVVNKLAERGLVATIEHVGLRAKGVVFESLHLEHPNGVVRGDITRVVVGFGFGGVSRVAVAGGQVQLKGEVNQVVDALRGPARAAPSELPPEREPVAASLEDLAIEWDKPLGDNSRLSVSGLRIEREKGALMVRAVEGQGAGLGLSGHLEAIAARIRTADWGIQSLQVQGGNVVVDWGQTGAAAVTPEVTAQPTEANPSNPALVWVSLSPGRGQRLREWIRRGVGVVARRLPAQGALELDHMTLTLRRGNQTLSIGPGRVYGQRDDELVRLGFVSGGSQDNVAFEASLEAPLGDGKVEGRVKGGPVALATLGVRPGNFGLQEVDRTQVTIDSQFSLAPDGSRADFSTMGDIRALALQHERIAPYALTDIDLGWSLEGHLGLDGSEFEVKAGKVNFGRVQGVTDVALVRSEQRLEMHVDFKIDVGSCADMFQALPNGAAPLLTGADMAGDFRWQGGINLDTDHLTDTTATWNMRNRCRFVHIPEDAHPDQFRTQFALNVPDFDGQPMDLRTGPGTPHWTPFEEMSPYMESAVLTTEDGGFWNHHGFDTSAIESAIKRNMESGKFTRGASTISMQLAKNLYLERDKYIARKIQEALLTMLLEQELKKQEILELYLNVIEYGPGVYGIRNAAKHYFNSSPGELSVAQCFFLASILPKPKGRYFEDNGALSLHRARMVRSLLKIAHDRKRLTALDLTEGLAEQLQFGVPHLASNPYRNGDGSLNSEPFYPGGTDFEDRLE